MAKLEVLNDDQIIIYGISGLYKILLERKISWAASPRDDGPGSGAGASGHATNRCGAVYELLRQARSKEEADRIYPEIAQVIQKHFPDEPCQA